MCGAARCGGAAKWGVGRGGGAAKCGAGCGAMAGRCGMAGGWNAGAAGRAMAGGAAGRAMAGGGAAGRAAGAAAGPAGPPLPCPGPWADAPTLVASIETPTKNAVTQTPRGRMIVAPSSKPPTTLNARGAESFVVGRRRHCDLPTQAASGEILRQGRGELLQRPVDLKRLSSLSQLRAGAIGRGAAHLHRTAQDGGHERCPHGLATCCSALKRAFCSPLMA